MSEALDPQAEITPDSENSEAVNLEIMDPAAIREMVAELDQKYAEIDPDGTYTEETVQELFNYLNAVVLLNDLENAARLLKAIKPVIDTWFTESVEKESEEIEKALEFLVDWHMLSLRFTPESPKEFADVEHYRELLHAFEVAPPAFRLAEVKAKLQMVHHYLHWVKADGDIDALSDEDYEMLDDMAANYEDELAETITQKEASGEWKDLFGIKKTLHKYYQYRGKPNDAIQTLKDLIELAPKQETFSPADIADLEMDLAKLYMAYKKWKTARKYFLRAEANYAADPADLEMFEMQAESWARECGTMI